MKIIDKQNLEKELLDGAIVYMQESVEKRYYRFNNDVIEYSDNNEEWKESKLTIDDLKQNSFIRIN